MSLFNHEIEQVQGESSSAIAGAPIVVALNSLSTDKRTRLQFKFDIAYYIAKERLSFRKYPAICKLEARHGVNIVRAYINEISPRNFTHFIAKATRQKVVFQLQKCKFFSIILNSLTDGGNVDNELMMTVWFDQERASKRVHTRTSYFKISQPSSFMAEGLF